MEAGAFMALRGLGVATNTFRGATAAGALGDFLVTGADDKRLVDLFDAVPALQGPMLEAMQTDGNDNLWKHKLAAAGEGVLFGGAIEGLTRFVGSLRKVKVAQETGDPKAVQKALDEELPEMQASLKEIQAWHGSPHAFEEFDLSKAFSGEGTQAFGAGVYVAENKAVGRYYADLNSRPLGLMVAPEAEAAFKAEGCPSRECPRTASATSSGHSTSLSLSSIR